MEYTLSFAVVEVPRMNISYKPQKISPKFPGTVRQLLHNKIRDSYIHPQFVADVMKPLQLESLFDQEVTHLSGGELQRVALSLCLGQVARNLLFLLCYKHVHYFQPADIYLIDEPSAYLDSEQRLVAAKVIKRYASSFACCDSVLGIFCRFILHAKKTAFVVEHDFIMATYLADRVVVFEGTPSINTSANT